MIIYPCCISHFFLPPYSLSTSLFFLVCPCSSSVSLFTSFPFSSLFDYSTLFRLLSSPSFSSLPTFLTPSATALNHLSLFFFYFLCYFLPLPTFSTKFPLLFFYLLSGFLQSSLSPFIPYPRTFSPLL